MEEEAKGYEETSHAFHARSDRFDADRQHVRPGGLEPERGWLVKHGPEMIGGPRVGDVGHEHRHEGQPLHREHHDPHAEQDHEQQQGDQEYLPGVTPGQTPGLKQPKLAVGKSHRRGHGQAQRHYDQGKDGQHAGGYAREHAPGFAGEVAGHLAAATYF